ncbi:hypothetical protein AALC16_22670 [Lachnospiraceae bacterium 29-91]
MKKTHWKKLENPDYLGAYALHPGRDLTVQIKNVGQEEVYNPTNNKKEVCTVAHFTDKSVKPMILNVTNCKTISKIYDTPYIEDWAGKYITVYIAKVKAFGETVEALRIRNNVPTFEKIYCEDCGKEITGASGKTAGEIADIAIKNCGRKLCIECMKKEKKKREQVNTDGK